MSQYDSRCAFQQIIWFVSLPKTHIRLKKKNEAAAEVIIPTDVFSVACMIQSFRNCILRIRKQNCAGVSFIILGVVVFAVFPCSVHNKFYLVCSSSMDIVQLWGLEVGLNTQSCVK